MSLLEIKNLTTKFDTPQGVVSAAQDLTYSLEAGEILGIVGESGSGKSVGMLSLMGLLADNGFVESGEIQFNGQDISPPAGRRTRANKPARQAYEAVMQKLRGNEIGMIFQDPMTYLNPILSIRRQMTEGIIEHTGCSAEEADGISLRLMDRVGIPNPKSRFKQYPFEFSGGMRQRIIIAIALSLNPKLIIADEPTTALDVTVQAQILNLIREIAKSSGTAVALITHDLGVVASLCDRIMIMYAGRIVEEGTTDDIFYRPKHPYTLGLLGSVNNRAAANEGGKRELVPITGAPPDLLKLPHGCSFLPRCRYGMRICREAPPERTEFDAAGNAIGGGANDTRGADGAEDGGNCNACSCWLYDRRVPPKVQASVKEEAAVHVS